MLREIRPRILVVDDCVDTADSFALLLRMWGYDTEACYEGTVALETARAFQPQVVLLDIGMFGMDGFQVAQRLREQPGMRHVVFIAITGYSKEAYRTRAREVGFCQYLLKPVEPDYLLELFIRVIGPPGFLPDASADNEGVRNIDPPMGKGRGGNSRAPIKTPARETVFPLLVAL